MSTWNGNNFSIYKSEEKQVLKLIKELGDQVNYNTDNKTDKIGDHQGTWQGISKPTQSNEGLAGTVEKHETQLNVVSHNVKLSGALGNGITDDTESINDAIAYCQSIGKQRLYFPKGTYMVNGFDLNVFDVGNIKIPSNFEITLDPQAIIKVIANDKWGYSIFNLTDVENVYIHGGTLEGDRYNHNYSTYPTHEKHEWGYGIRGENCKNIIIKDMSLKNFTGDGINFSGTQIGITTNHNIIINNVTVDNNRRNGIAITNGKCIRLHNNTALKTDGTLPKAGIDIEGESSIVEDVIISGSYFSENTESGIQLMKCRNVKVIGNHFKEQLYGVLQVKDTQQIVVNGNTFDNATKIFIAQLKDYDLNFSGNVIRNGYVLLYPKDDTTNLKNVLIADNVFKNGAISVQSNMICQNVAIKNNLFTDVIGSSGISGVNFDIKTDNIEILGNGFYNIDGEGIIVNGIHMIVKDNKIERCKSHGIYLHSDSNYSVVKNNYIKDWGLDGSKSAIHNYGSKYINISDNDIIITDVMPIVNSYEGIYTWGEYATVLNNRLMRTGINTIGFYGIHIYSLGAIVNNNDIRNAFTTPIKIEDGIELIVPNNNYV